MEEEIQEVKAMLRSVLLSSKEGVTAERFLADYRSLTGELLPFKKFGYSNQSDFIASLPDVVHVMTNKFGETVYHAVADETTAHIQKLVSKQKSRKTKGPLKKTYVRHPSKPFRGRPPSSRGRGSFSMSSRISFSNHGSSQPLNIRDRGLPGKRSVTSREIFNNYSQQCQMTPVLNTNFKGDESQSENLWDCEDTENIEDKSGEKSETESWDSPRKPLRDMKITFDVNNSPSYQPGSRVSQRKVTNSNRILSRALDEVLLLQQQENKASIKSRLGPVHNKRYEVPPRFRKLEEEGNQYKEPSSATSSSSSSPSSSKLPNTDIRKVSYSADEDDSVIQDRVREIVAEARNGLWSSRVEVVYTEKYGKPAFDLVQKIKTWPDLFEVDQILDTDRIIIRLQRENPPTVTTTTTPTPTPSSPSTRGIATKKSPTTTTQPAATASYPAVAEAVKTKKPVIETSVGIWKKYTIPPPDLLELGNKVTVYVTFASHCDRFFVQREDCMVEYITDELLKYCKTVSPPDTSVLVKGVYCAALYSEDDTWYRAQILSDIKDKMVEVCFVDYGNTDMVNVSSIRALPEEIAHIPTQAIPCTLFGVQRLESSDDYKTSPAMLAFAELVRDTPLHATTVAHTINGLCEVELCIPDNSISINKQLIDRHLVVSSLSEGAASGNGRQEVNQKEITDGEPDDLILPDDKLWDVYVSFLSPSLEVSIRLVGEQYSDKLEQLENQMAQIYQKLKPVTMVTEGMVYILNSETLYHRVRVISVAENKAFVMYCDHGDKEFVDLSKLRPLPPEINKTLPYQAFQCVLYGLENLENLENKATAVELLLDMALAKVLVADIVSRDDDLVVILYDTECEEDININQVVTMELMKKGEKLDLSLFSECSVSTPSESASEVETGGYDLNSSESYETAKSSVSSQSITNKDRGDYKEISDSSHNPSAAFKDTGFGDVTRRLANVSVDDKVNPSLEEYTDTDMNFNSKKQTYGACYRCNIEVDLADAASRGLLLPSGDSLLSSKAPVCCKRCSAFEGLKGGSDGMLPSGDARFTLVNISKLHSLDASHQQQEEESNSAEASTSKCLYTWDSRKNTPPSTQDPGDGSGDNKPERNVDLDKENPSRHSTDESGDNVLKGAAGETAGDIPDKVSRRNDSVLSTARLCTTIDGDCTSSGPAQADTTAQLQLPPKLSIPGPRNFIDIHVLWVVDPHNFVCILYNMMDEHQQTMANLNKYFSSLPMLAPLPVDNLQPDKIYAGCIERIWCRIILKDIVDGEASVYLPDQGTFNIMPATEIFDIPAKFLKLPFVAINAKLHGIEPLGDNQWSESAKYKFAELVHEKDLVALIVYKNDDNNIAVKLVDTSGESDVCIDEVLIALKLAKTK